MAVEFTSPSRRLTLGRDRIIFDGAMGTALGSRGLRRGSLPEELNLSSPETVAAVHRSFLEAGSDFITTNTFGAFPSRLAHAGLSVGPVVRSACQIARREAERFGGFVALDIGPSGRLMEPLGDATFDEIYQGVCEVLHAGAAYCDAVLLETFTDLAEIRAAALAVRENCGLPLLATMSFEPSGRTFSGASAEACSLVLSGLGASAFGTNCSAGPRALRETVRQICGACPVPVIVQPNAGLPEFSGSSVVYSAGPDEFQSVMGEFARWGVAVLGGCCGTTPDYIRRLSSLRGDVPPRSVPLGPAACSASQVVRFDMFVPVGERINPTGKPVLADAYASRLPSPLLEDAIKQTQEGAVMLDVNAGVPGVDEAAALSWAVQTLQEGVACPLQLDSANPKALEAALRACVGLPMINSASARPESLEPAIRLAKKYGVSILGLPMDETGVPERAADRLAVAARIKERWTAAGLAAEKLLFDPLVMAAAAGPERVSETLNTLSALKERLGAKTMAGISNVSFGLPARGAVNRTMLAACLDRGLDAAILNPGDLGMMDTVAVWNLLSGRDADASGYLAYCAARPEELEPESRDALPVPEANQDNNEDELGRAVRLGLVQEARRAAAELCKGVSAMTVVEEYLVPALDRVGDDYEAGRIFLPGLLKAASAASAAFDEIRQALPAGSGARDKGPIVLATVQGDVHDIGKNIAGTVLESYGFRVIDLGKNVPAETVVRTVVENRAPLVGLSALMTATVASMEDTVAALRRAAPGVKIIVGGAVLSRVLAQSIGADYYAATAMETVRLAEKAIKLKERE